MDTKIKICGITREQDAEAVVQAGADALGLMFVQASARAISLERARDIAAHTAGSVMRVGVFADPAPDQVERVLRLVSLDVLQFHGSEPGPFCERWGLPYVKALRVGGAESFQAVAREHPEACALMLDAFRPGALGGTGERFDLSLWPADVEARLVLAGGLDPQNVADAIARTRPWGVDVSSGVEGATRGLKCARRINEFVHAVRQAE